MARLVTQPALTVYELATLFAALKDQVDTLDAQLAPCTEAERNYAGSPKAMRDAFERIMNVVAQWQNEGFAYAVTARPFSDASVTGRVEDRITMQFGNVAFPKRAEACQVKPVKAESFQALGLSL